MSETTESEVVETQPSLVKRFFIGTKEIFTFGVDKLEAPVRHFPIGYAVPKLNTSDAKKVKSGELFALEGMLNVRFTTPDMLITALPNGIKIGATSKIRVIERIKSGNFADLNHDSIIGHVVFIKPSADLVYNLIDSAGQIKSVIKTDGESGYVAVESCARINSIARTL